MMSQSINVPIGKARYISQIYKGTALEFPIKERELIFQPFVEKRENDDQIIIVFMSDTNFQYPNPFNFQKTKESLNDLQKILFKSYIPVNPSKFGGDMDPDSSNLTHQSGLIIQKGTHDEITEVIFYIIVEFCGPFVTYEI